MKKKPIMHIINITLIELFNRNEYNGNEYNGNEYSGDDYSGDYYSGDDYSNITNPNNNTFIEDGNKDNDDIFIYLILGCFGCICLVCICDSFKDFNCCCIPCYIYENVYSYYRICRIAYHEYKERTINKTKNVEKYLGKHVENSSFDEEEKCSICLDGLNKKLVTLPCNHTFHKNCIKEWLVYSEDVACPLCRKECDIKFVSPIRKNTVVELNYDSYSTESNSDQDYY